MATPRAGHRASTTGSVGAARRRWVRGLGAVLAVVALAGVVPGAADADPGSIAAARRELTALSLEVDRAVEDYAEAALTVSRARRDAQSVSARLAAQEKKVRARTAALDSLAASVYISGGTDDVFTLLTTATPSTLLERAGVLDRVARHREVQLRDARTARRRLDLQRRSATAVLARAAAAERRLGALRRSVASKVARQESLLRRLETEQARSARIAREAAAARAARQRALRASRDTERAPLFVGSPSERARIAVNAAYAQLGKPYKWAAEGPDSFDCSGLTMYVWAKAGVSLPHSSRLQFHEGRHVSRAELIPGDLVFYGSPIHHMGIYVGGGRYINAPQTGDVVKVASVDRRDWAGAVRL